ncbi:DNA replication/repair protein RecF [Gluconobacter cerinus]|uniref:DNA replication/repair protein RecF n=1 Tax=Gluconobacter cerinus TaxID=38307 RepID=UPI001B8B2FB0|nr:DNA replication/repair protein RecF [Gluconobacter cerinus]MBS1025703.1 DNA replication/repair protein RecF [Gluconobacter cerinus]MBS1037128.1 DNA replication/repair protein RecF [Gluconobacter cerinus]MBS1043692.1 DNA replication/repair protein RecF [Gluconobacter cerinus]
MRLTRLALTDFRNYRHSVWKPETNISVLTGQNGSGKTNLLEAVSLLAPGRGLRGAPLQALCRTNADHWGVAATLSHGIDQTILGTGANLSENGRRSFQLDGSSVRSQAEIAQIFSCVWLTPQMDRIFLEGAGGRRRFLDRLVMALSPDHARQMTAHERSVSSRNRLLSERPDEGLWLTSLEDSIARHAVAASAARLALVESMNTHPFDSSNFPKSRLHLDCAITQQLMISPALQVEDWLRAKLRDSRREDRLKGSTSLGAHKADFLLFDHTTGRSAELSSSGQQKAMLLGVVLCHAALIEQSRGDAPAILLDEPLLHLDEPRRDALLSSLSKLKTPVLLTGTDPDPFSSLIEKAGFFSVQDGHIQPA